MAYSNSTRSAFFAAALVACAATLISSSSRAINLEPEVLNSNNQRASVKQVLAQTTALTPEEWTSKYQCSQFVFDKGGGRGGDEGKEENLSLYDRDRARQLNANISYNPHGDEDENESIQSDERMALTEENRMPWYKRIWFKLMSECNRELLAWRYTYVDELIDGFHQLVRDRSTDERLANIIYSTSINGLVDHSYFRFNSGDWRQDKRNEQLIAGTRVDDEQCALDLADMSQQLDRLEAQLEEGRSSDSESLSEQQVRLVRALDAFGRYNSGSLGGINRAVGAYEQCISTSLLRSVESRTSSIEMRYCWAKMSLDKQLNGLLRRRQKFAHEQAETGLISAVCLPATCHTRNLASHKATLQRLIDSQLQLPRSLYLNHSLELDSIFCLVDEDAPFGMPNSGKLCVAFIVSWLLLCIAVTLSRKPARDRNLPIELSPRQVSVEALDVQSVESSVSEIKAQHMGLAGEKVIAATVSEQQQQQQQQKQQQKQAQRQTAVAVGATRVAPSHKGKSRSRFDSMLACFDLVHSWRDFSADKRSSSATARVDLDVLNPVKLFCCVFVVAAHSALMHASVSDKPLEIAALVERDFIIQAAFIGSVVVDTFFVMSGMLLTFIMLKKLHAGFGFGGRGQVASERCDMEEPRRHNETSISANLVSTGRGRATSSLVESGRVSVKLALFMANWFVLAVNRYLRIVPLYALMWWFRRDVLTYLGSGPLWDFGFNKETTNGACLLESWTTPLTPVSAFTPLSKQCFVPSWSVSNDIFFGLLLPLFILGLKHRPRQAQYAMLALIAICTLGSLYHWTESTQPESRWELSEFKLHGVILLFNGLSQVYTWPIYRVPSFFLGAIAGHALYRYDSNSKRAAVWPRWLTGPATWIAGAYMMAHLVISIYPIEIKIAIYPYQRLLAAYFMTLDRSLWAASNAVLFLRMVTDWRGSALLRSFASQRWRTLARLNYAVLFVHWCLITVQIGVMVALPYFSRWQVYASFASIYLMTLPIALMTHVAFENPIDKLIKTQLFRL